MSRKRYTPEQIIGMLREAEVGLVQGHKVGQARRLKDLERENIRLRKAVSDLTLDKQVLNEAIEENY
jgi:hypothetical protein